METEPANAPHRAPINDRVIPTTNPTSLQTPGRKTPTADVNGGKRLLNQLRPPLRNRPSFQTTLPSQHWFRPLRFPSKTSARVQGTHRLRLVCSKWHHHTHIRMDITDPQFGTSPRLHMAFRSSGYPQSLVLIYYPPMDSSSTVDTTVYSMVSPHSLHQGPPHLHPSPVSRLLQEANLQITSLRNSRSSQNQQAFTRMCDTTQCTTSAPHQAHQ